MTVAHRPIRGGGWAQVRLGAVADVRNGYPFDSTGFNSISGIPVVRIRDLLEGQTQTFFEGAIPQGVDIDDGDLLIGMDGDFNVVVWHGGRACMNQRVCSLRAKAGARQGFINYAVSNLCRSINSETPATTVKHLSSLELLRRRIPFPSEEEQRRVAAFLDAEGARADSLIDAYRRTIALAEAAFRTRQVDLLTGLGHADRHVHPLLGLVPSHWRTMRAKFCTGGITVGVVVNPSSYFVDTGIPFIHGTDVREGFVDQTDLKFISDRSNAALAKSQVRTGDVVAMRVGYPGRAAVVPPELDGANCASILIFRRSPVLAPAIISEFLNSVLGRLQIEAVQYGAAQDVMNVSDAVNLVLPVPPVDEQPSIVHHLEGSRKYFAKIGSVIGNQIALLRERKLALITAAVTGKIAIPGAD